MLNKSSQLILFLVFYIILSTNVVIASPTVPILVPHAEYHSEGTTTVSWYASTGCGQGCWYNVKVGTSSGGTNVLTQFTANTQSSSFGLTPGNPYYWSVQACNGETCGEPSAWSEEDVFGFANNAPSVPLINAHADYHTSASTTYSWSASTDPEGDTITYHYNVGTTSGGTQVFNDQTTTGTSTTGFTTTISNSYFGKVKACDTWLCSAYSSEDQFDWTNSAPVMQSNVVTPSNPNTSSTLTATVSATDADGDTPTYTYQWYKDESSIGGATASTLSPPLTSGSSYKVLVTPSDTWASGTATYSNTVSLSSYEPSSPVNITSTCGNFYCNFTWQKGSGNITDSFNISVVNKTGAVWSNGTTVNYTNRTSCAHCYENISVFSFNTSLNGTINLTSVGLNSTVPNNVPSMVNITISPSAPFATDNLTVSLNYTDLDTDSVVNHFLWYKNGVLNTSWNDTTTLLFANLTISDIIYVVGFVNDSFSDSSQLQSGSVVFGSSNSQPNFTALTLIPSTKKYNKTINVNASGILDDSASWRLQVYWLNDSNRTYLVNSSFGSTSFINTTIIIPWSVGTTYTIYGEVHDSGNITNQSNTTSDPKSATFTLNTTSPTITTSSVSSSTLTVGGSVNITAMVNGQNANISSANVRVERPDAIVQDWAMTCATAENVTCYKLYTSTSDIGIYYVRFINLTDDSNINGSYASSLTFTASAASSGSGSGGGGVGGGTTIIYQDKDEDNATSIIPLLTLKNITSGATEPQLQEIADCLTEGLVMENKCSAYNYGVVVEPMNWWVFAGAFLASFGVVVGRGIHQDKAREWVTEPLLYGTTTTLVLIVLVAVGINTYILNYLADSPKYAWTFASTALWGGIVALVWDNYYYGKKKYKIRRNA